MGRVSPGHASLLRLCPLVGSVSQAGAVNAITWKNLSLVNRDSGIVLPGSRSAGLARSSCKSEVDF